jgi:ABC-type antimicrobial peptide transport system permease subunit
MEEVVSKSIGSQRFNALLLSTLALLALVLAAVGIYGVVSYLVTQRTREIGVRVALGATRADVLKLVLRQGLTSVGLGLAAGIAAAFGLSRLLESLVQGVSSVDPLAFVAAPSALLAVAVASIYLPARRAAGVDPLVALRAE